MLYSLVLTLVAQTDARLAASHGHQAHAVFLELVRQADPQLSARLHSGGGRKPFTVSALRQLDGQPARAGNIVAGWRYRLRFTLLEDAAFAALLRLLVRPDPLPEIRLDQAEFMVQDAATAPGVDPWSRCTTFQDLVDEAVPERELRLEFVSPTAFSLGERGWGRRVELLPTPELVFDSLIRRWRAHGGPALADDLLPRVVEGVVVARYQLRSEFQMMGTRPQVGFAGWCVYQAKGTWDRQLLRELNALAEFAFYAGVGYKTTMGMGQCRRVRATPTPDGSSSAGLGNDGDEHHG